MTPFTDTRKSRCVYAQVDLHCHSSVAMCMGVYVHIIHAAV